MPLDSLPSSTACRKLFSQNELSTLHQSHCPTEI